MHERSDKYLKFSSKSFLNIVLRPNLILDKDYIFVDKQFWDFISRFFDAIKIERKIQLSKANNKPFV